MGPALPTFSFHLLAFDFELCIHQALPTLSQYFLGQVKKMLITAIMLYKGKTWQDSGILWNTLAYSGILWHTLAYSGILWHTLAYSGILWHTLAYSGILCHTLAY